MYVINLLVLYLEKPDSLNSKCAVCINRYSKVSSYASVLLLCVRWCLLLMSFSIICVPHMFPLVVGNSWRPCFDVNTFSFWATCTRTSTTFSLSRSRFSSVRFPVFLQFVLCTTSTPAYLNLCIAWQFLFVYLFLVTYSSVDITKALTHEAVLPGSQQKYCKALQYICTPTLVGRHKLFVSLASFSSKHCNAFSRWPIKIQEWVFGL